MSSKTKTSIRFVFVFDDGYDVAYVDISHSASISELLKEIKRANKELDRPSGGCSLYNMWGRDVYTLLGEVRSKIDIEYNVWLELTINEPFDSVDFDRRQRSYECEHIFVA